MTQATVSGIRQIGSDMHRFSAPVECENGEDPAAVFLDQVADPDEFEVLEVER